MNQSKNIEIKARCENLAFVRNKLHELKADFKGVDHQIDTYYNSREGRLKMREGNIETNLIHYNRPNQSGPKQSDFTLFKTDNPEGLKDILSKSMGVKVVVDKKREIYFIKNVKFHIDEVQELGNFVEIEVTDMKGDRTVQEMQVVCEEYMQILNIKSKDLLQVSYNDLLLEKRS